MSDYVIIKKSALPDYLKKVIKAKKLLNSSSCSSIKEACEICDISRSSYYKYSPYIYDSTDQKIGHIAQLNLIIDDVSGSLNEIIELFHLYKSNIITINQSMPINNLANIHVTLDIANLSVDINELIKQLLNLACCKKAELLLIE